MPQREASTTSLGKLQKWLHHCNSPFVCDNATDMEQDWVWCRGNGYLLLQHGPVCACASTDQVTDQISWQLPRLELACVL